MKAKSLIIKQKYFDLKTEPGLPKLISSQKLQESPQQSLKSMLLIEVWTEPNLDYTLISLHCCRFAYFS